MTPPSIASSDHRDADDAGQDASMSQQRLDEASAALKRQAEQLLQLQLAKIQRQMAAQQLAIDSLARDARSIPLSHPSPAPAIVETPVRASLVNRRLDVESASSRKGPSPLALAHQASIAGLPNAAVSVKTTDVDRLSSVAHDASVTTASATPALSVRVKLTAPEKFSGSDVKQNADVDEWIVELDLARILD